MNATPRRLVRAALGAALLCLGSSAPGFGAVAPAPPAPRVLVLVRHGHYAADPLADPKLGPGLTALGVAQARLAGARLAGFPQPFEAVLASPLQRAAETARVIASDLGADVRVQTVAELEECTPPTWREQQVKDEPIEDQKACAAQLDRLFAERFVPATGDADQLVMRELPFQMDPVSVQMLWPLRLDADPAQRWLRGHLMRAATPGDA